YSSVFVICGAAVLGLTYLLFSQAAHPAAHLSSGSPVGASGSKLTQAVERATTQAIGAVNTQIAFDRQVLLVASAIALAVFAVAVAAIGWLLAGRVLRPLSTMSAAARRISASSLHERLAL